MCTVIYPMCIQYTRCVNVLCVLTCVILYPPVDSKDYMGGPFAVTFAPEENITCAYISIINDAIYEGDENFFIDIVALSEAMLTLGGRVSVTIQDDDTGDV